MNKVIISGKLVRDPEMRYTESGKATATFSLAVWKPSRNNNDKYTFFRCATWNETAERAMKSLKKGDYVIVDGSLNVYDYVDKEGVKKTLYTVNCALFDKVPSYARTEGDSQELQEEISENVSYEDDLPF
jgi:single-strand DNA-binding protein